jgi:competence protein ComEC
VRRFEFVSGLRSSECLQRGSPHSPGATCLAGRRAAARILALGIEDSPRTVGLLRALLLGYRSDLTPGDRDLFAVTGTLHIFAISGLHVGIVCLLLMRLLSALGVPRTLWAAWIAPALAVYTFATGAKPSAVRACIMAVLFVSAPLLGRRPDSLSAVAAAALLILGVYPKQLQQAGFVLSFVVVTGLILLVPVAVRCLELAVAEAGVRFGRGTRSVMPLFWEPDPARDRSAPNRLAWLQGAVRYLASLVALSCSAWLVSAPLTAYYFGRFTPIAIVGNVLVVPLAFLIVLGGCLSLLLGSVLGVCAAIFNHANLALATVLVQALRLMSRVPGGAIDVPRPSPWAVGLWYALLAVFGAALAKMVDKRAGQV